MGDLYSIPLTAKPICEELARISWTIPPEAEEAFRRHNPDSGLNLAHLFHVRCRCDQVIQMFSWLLVVLPKAYPIGGYLAKARCGPKTNLIIIDYNLLNAKVEDEKEAIAATNPLFFPDLPKTGYASGVSSFWVQSKGMLRVMSEQAGGFLGDVYRKMAKVPQTRDRCWVYFADAPGDEFLNEVSAHNITWYDEWQQRYLGPPYDLDDKQLPNATLAFAQASIGRQRLRFLRRYLRKNPGDARAWTLRAKSHYFQNQPMRALVVAKKALELAPESHFARLQYAFCLIQAGRCEEAATELRLILDKSPNDLTSLFALNSTLKVTGGEEERMQTLERLTDLALWEPGLVDLGLIYYRRGWRKKAKECFEQAVLHDPEYPTAINNLGYVLAEEGDLENALVLCKRSCELEKTSQSVDSLGFVYLRMNRLEEAKRLFKEALVIDPANKEAEKHLVEAMGAV